MGPIDAITTYLEQNSRNKIVFCKEAIPGLDYVDVGFQLASELSKTANPTMSCEAVVRQMMDLVYVNDVIGKYLAIQNIFMLFEPELKLNVRDIIDSSSKDKCLVIMSPGEVSDGKLMLAPSSSQTTVCLDNLSFLVI